MRKSSMLVGLMVIGAIVGSVGAASAQADSAAPPAQLSADGRSVSVPGGPTLSVSQAAGLSDGQSITVSGSGFDQNKGIYIALCAIPPTGHPPSPCGGGQDREGGAGVSTWISSNPPSYGEGVADPYGPGGSFTTTFAVSPMISQTIDCRMVACAIVTRNDHVRSTDRSQDLFVPVSFAVPGEETPAPTTTAPQPTTTLAPTTTTTTVPPPEATVAEDGLSVSDGVRSLSVSTVEDLDPAGASVDVVGSGYSDTAGVLVALCAVGVDGAAPGPCTSGSAGASAWISSTPPDYGADLAEPYGDAGSFAVTLTVPAVIDADTDCRQVACAISTRPDDESSQDRSQELLVPVSFAATSPETTTTEAAEAADEPEAAAPDEPAEEAASSTPWLPIVAGLAVVAAAGVAVWRRRAAVTAAGGTTSGPDTDGPPK